MGNHTKKLFEIKLNDIELKKFIQYFYFIFEDEYNNNPSFNNFIFDEKIDDFQYFLSWQFPSFNSFNYYLGDQYSIKFNSIFDQARFNKLLQVSNNFMNPMVPKFCEFIPVESCSKDKLEEIKEWCYINLSNAWIFWSNNHHEFWNIKKISFIVFNHSDSLIFKLKWT